MYICVRVKIEALAPSMKRPATLSWTRTRVATLSLWMFSAFEEKIHL